VVFAVTSEETSVDTSSVEFVAPLMMDCAAAASVALTSVLEVVVVIGCSGRTALSVCELS
jgi:hypothetical protein